MSKNFLAACIILVSQLVMLPPIVHSQAIWIHGGGSASFRTSFSDFSGTGAMIYLPLPNFGTTLQWSFTESSSFETGVQFMRHGMQSRTVELLPGVPLSVIADLTAKTWYMEIPLLLKLKSSISEKADIVGSFGGYVGIGLRGWAHVLVTEPTSGIRHEAVRHAQWSWTYREGENTWSRFTYGQTFGVGIEWEQTKLHLMYSHMLQGIEFHQSTQLHSVALTLGFRILNFERADGGSDGK